MGQDYKLELFVDSCNQTTLDKIYPGSKCVDNKSEVDDLIG